MKRKRIVILFVALVLGVLALSTLLGPMRRSGLVSAANDKPKGKLTKVFRREKQNKDEPLPDWVDQAFKKGKGHLKQGGREWSKQLIDVESELDVEIAEEDDLGETRVRVGQVFNGVPVIGGQLIIHEDANGVRETDGRGFSAARHVDTNPKLKPKDALDAATKALGYKGKFANEPQANLVILPNEMIDPKNRIGANLVYVVELLIEDGTDAMGRYFYYVDANDGHIVWNYNAMTTINGNSQYSGQVTIPTRIVNGQYWMQDTTRGANGIIDKNISDGNFDQATQELLRQSGNWTTDVNHGCDNPCGADKPPYQAIGTIFTSGNDSWGDGQPYGASGTDPVANGQTAAVDVHFGSMQTWDYFHNIRQRDGIDGNNYRMLTRVHFSTNYNNAIWNGDSTAFGDSSSGRPYTSLDVVGHEITHGLFEKALGIYSNATRPLVYTRETAAFNESFADIFGTAVEFYARERQCIRCPTNPGQYQTCEQRPGVGSCLVGNYYLLEDQRGGQSYSRDMANPNGIPSGITLCNPSDHVDHYDKYCSSADPHYNLGVQNKAFWMLAQTGTITHPYSGIAVTGIGRANAEKIFYKALTQYLTYADRTFAAVRWATLRAATDQFGFNSPEYNSTAQAWLAVGVPPNEIDLTKFFVEQQYFDFLSRFPDASGRDFWIGNINNCTPQPSCIDTQRVNTSAAFFLSIEFQQTGYLVERMYKAAYGDASGTSTYGGSHTLSVPTVHFSDFLPDTRQISQNVIVGQTGWETQLENNKQAFANAFVQRSPFISAFPTSMTPAQFVDTLNAHAGNVLSSSDRTTAINLFGGASDTSNTTARAQAVRQVAENQNFVTAEFNRAFVLMQYFGYLRRDPNSGADTDYTGYDFWLQKLNFFNGDYNQAEMVKAFITSIEYRQRFGQV
jgi:thermolysin